MSVSLSESSHCHLKHVVSVGGNTHRSQYSQPHAVPIVTRCLPPLEAMANHVEISHTKIDDDAIVQRRVARPLVKAVSTPKVPKINATTTAIYDKNTQNRTNLSKYKGEPSLMELVSRQSTTPIIGPTGKNQVSLRRIIHGWWPRPY